MSLLASEDIPAYAVTICVSSTAVFSLLTPTISLVVIDFSPARIMPSLHFNPTTDPARAIVLTEFSTCSSLPSGLNVFVLLS